VFITLGQSCNNKIQQERPLTYCTNNLEFASILENPRNHAGIDYLFEFLILEENKIEFLIQDSFNFSKKQLCYSIASIKVQELPAELVSYFELFFQNSDSIFINGRLGNELILSEEFKRLSIQELARKPFFLGWNKTRTISKDEVTSLILFYNRIIVQIEKLRNEKAQQRFNDSFENLNFNDMVEIAKEIPLKIYMNVDIKFGSLVLTPEVMNF
jgi:hypothetical protein